MVNYKQLCTKCRKNYVQASWKNRYPVCYECHSKEMNQEIKDPKMKKFFDIPEEFYKNNSFLRSIKINYLRYGELSDRQIEAFKEAVKKMKEDSE